MSQKAQLLDMLCSNYTVKDGSITVAMRSPFNALLKAVQGKDWLGVLDEVRTAALGEKRFGDPTEAITSRLDI